MSRFFNYVNELSSIYGKGITFIDIDETIFKTFAKIYVLNKESGKIIKKLSNQEFNTYNLQPEEEFDFREFKNAELFNKTSIPIDKTIKRIKRMFQNINKRGSRVVLLTARGDFDNKETFLNTFKKIGIPIDDIYVERAGNMKTGTVSTNKEKIIKKYLSTGEYRRVRLIDDDIKNVKTFLKLKKKLPSAIVDKVKAIHHIEGEESIDPIEFYGLLVQPNGSLKKI